MNSRILNIKGAVLDRYQLENYLEKVASDHILTSKSDKSTYPVPRLIENFKFITKTYEILNEDLKIGISIHPAGEWLLDNYYIIEEKVKIKKKRFNGKIINDYKISFKKDSNIASCLQKEKYKDFDLNDLAEIYIINSPKEIEDIIIC